MPATHGVGAVPSDEERRLQVALLLLRLGVLSVMVLWSVDKLVAPGHAARVFETFYGVPGLAPAASRAMGVAQLAVVAAFGAGLWKRTTYGLVLTMHAVSTLSSWERYLEPWEGANRLFFAAWPMLAACVALYLLRDRDRLGSWSRRGTR